MHLRIENLDLHLQVCETAAQFGQPLDYVVRRDLAAHGLGEGRARSIACLGWIWGQWLAGMPVEKVRNQVRVFVEQGLEMESLSPHFYLRPQHQLYLLHCAILAGDWELVLRVAGRTMDSEGMGAFRPRNDGELYVSAWCGVLKHRILENERKVVEQAEIWQKAKLEPSLPYVDKGMVCAWLGRDWAQFVERQNRGFTRLWDDARKQRGVVLEQGQDTVVDMGEIRQLQRFWCWPHCGMALLARHDGVKVAVDEFWFPV